MIQKILLKMAMSNRQHPVYIVPTADGFKLLALNFVLLAIGLVYANNYVLLFNFILFCLCISSMFYTHFNLNKLQLENFHIEPMFQNEMSIGTFHFKTNSIGHFFLRAKIYSDIISLNEEQSFKLEGKDNTAKFYLKGLRRGKGRIHALYIETTFPFNFFRCFTLYKINSDIWVFPERLALNLHQENLENENQNKEEDNFFLREYIPGESMKQMDWKRFAKNEDKYIRSPDNKEEQTLILSIKNSSQNEDGLKSLCHAIFRCHINQIRYGLVIGDTIKIRPDHSSTHLIFCLEQLASYEA